MCYMFIYLKIIINAIVLLIPMAILTLHASLHDAINSTWLEAKCEILTIPNNKLSIKKLFS